MNTRWAVATAVRFSFALVLFALGALLFRMVDPIGDVPPWWALGGWTTLVATLLWSVRRQLDRLADRLVFGTGADGYDSMRQLLQRMSTTLEVDDVMPQLAESLGRRMHSSRTEVRVALDDGERWSQVWPPAAEVSGQPLTVEIRHLGDAVGELELDAVDAQRRLLDEISGQAGLAMSTVRLTWSLRRRVAQLEVLNDELRSSQARLVGARLAAGRRLQAEVDDRVMPHLKAVGTTIADARTAIEQGRPIEGLDRAARRLSQALDTLRSIARGIFPPRLSEAGLQVCLEAWRDSVGIPIAVAVTGDIAPLRAAPDIETCLYFCLVTALQAVVDSAARISVQVDTDGTKTTFRLTAAGVRAFPELTATAVTDRLAAFGGGCEIRLDDSGLTLSGGLVLVDDTDHGSAALVLGTSGAKLHGRVDR